MVNDVVKICEDCKRLNDFIYDNKIFIKPDKNQEDTFYSNVDSFINRFLHYIEQYKTYPHVQKTLEIIEQLESSNDREHLSYKFESMKKTLVEVYLKYSQSREKETNFIAAVEPIVFFPIRVVGEILYREFTKEKLDSSLDIFLEDKKI